MLYTWVHFLTTIKEVLVKDMKIFLANLKDMFSNSPNYLLKQTSETK